MSEMAGGPYLLTLAGAEPGDDDRIGRKAANLAELTRAGYRVPEGVVLTTDALARLLDSARSATAEVVRDLRLPDDVAEAVREIAAHFGDEPVAVRSSGVAEDLPGMSFAGQYETVLGVRGHDELVEAVRTCWSSAFADRVIAYRNAAGSGEGTRMAVLVQRMVPARVAGVAFSANPVNGRRNEAVVSAVIGLGEQLVSGRVSPDEWVVGECGAAERQSGSLDAIDEAAAREVADLVRSVEAHFGRPQDIEWAIDDDGLWLLQARPITALPEPAAGVETVEVPPGHWRRDTYFRRPLTPMQRSIMLPVLNATSRLLFSYNIVDRLESREIGGWLYTQFVPLSGHERVTARLGEIQRAAAAGEPRRMVDRWETELAPRLAERSATLAAIDLPALSDEEAVTHFRDVEALYAEAQDTHFRVGGAILYLWSAFGATCERLLGWGAATSVRLITGLPGKTTEPSVRLAELAALARSRPPVRAMLAEPATDATVAALADVDPEFDQGLRGYLRDFGHRSLSLDLTDPTLAERPAFVLNLIRDQLDRDFDPGAGSAELARDREAAEAEARAILAEHGEEDRAAFEAVLADARRSYPVRDDKAFYTGVARGLLRYAIRDIGRRLAERERIGATDDVFALESDEMVRALVEGGTWQERVARRSAELAWVRAHPGPATYDGPTESSPPGGGRPAGDWRDRLTAEQRQVVDIILWLAEADNAGPSGAPRPDTLNGVAASPGRYTGTVRVILDESEFDELQPGDVLVCHETNPQWAVLFPNVGALVTDAGGLLSHPAIIAREYRIPAVVATREATSRLTDGQIVTVDGTAGEVEVR